MVGFSRHKFTLSASDADWKLKLLHKYYKSAQVQIQVTTADASVQLNLRGDLDEKFVQKVGKTIQVVVSEQLMESPQVVVITDHLWSEKACIQCLPTPPLSLNTDTKEKFSDLVKAMTWVIQTRLHYQAKEILIQTWFNQAKPEQEQEWSHVSSAVEQVLVQEDTRKHITRYFISEVSRVCLLVLQDRYTIVVNLLGCADGQLPTLDVDDGFAQNGFGSAVIPKEFQTKFATWKARLESTHGQSWDESIL